MKRFALTIALVLSLPATAVSQTSSEADVRTFELTAVAPPTPSLKYQLLFDDLGERRPGNAAILYLQAALLLGPDAPEQANKALDAYEAKDMKAFAERADSLHRGTLFQQLELAARREVCDWEPPFREMGAETLLPHLHPLAHGVGKSIKVRALRQIQQGKTAEALGTLRLGYELSDKVGREPVLISAIVSLGITGWMNDCLADLMNHPDAPNLYWALSQLPSRQAMFRHAMDGERSWMIPSVPHLAKAMAGEELSAEQWRAALAYVGKVIYAPEGQQRKTDPVKDATPDTLRQAQKQYVEAHRLTAEQVDKLDPIIVLGDYYFRQYQIAFDEMYTLRGFPYPVQLLKSREHEKRVAKLRDEQPGNPFFQVVSEVRSLVWRFARADREHAALTAVEAIRSYAAANNGKLPARLEDITDTPVPENPATGEPFEYRVEKYTATLADSKSEKSLIYTIKIRSLRRGE
jgi:hypothetical protein